MAGRIPTKADVDKADVDQADIARSRAELLRRGLSNYRATLVLLADAWRQDDWRALGYADWKAYLDGELGVDRMRLPDEYREMAISAFREAGMSMRAIVAATKLGIGTVSRTTAGVPSGTPAAEIEAPKVKGLDKKTYDSTKPKAAPKPAPEPESVAADESAPEPEVEQEPASEQPAEPPVTEPEPEVEKPSAKAKEAVPKAAKRSVVDEIAEADPNVQAADFMMRFTAALRDAGALYLFPADRVAKLAKQHDVESLERHADLVVAYLAEVKANRPTHLRLVSGGS